MAPFKSIVLLGLALAPLASTHFVVNIPPPLGSNIDNEEDAPCGGFTPSDSDNLTDFHVGGDAVSLITLHPQCFFEYRGMLGSSLASPNWTQLIPTVEEYGLNKFCEPSIAVPESWAGSTGLLQIVQDSGDGVHYQCMHVNFVAGVGSAKSQCTNSSGVSAQFASDPTLSTALSATATVQSISSANSASSTPASTSSKSAAHPVFKTAPLSDCLFAVGLLLVTIAF